MPKIRGVILDLDGTLIDSNDGHALAWQQAMREAGFDPGYEKIRRLIGMGGDFLIPEAIGIAADSDTGKQISRRRREIFRERYLPDLKPLPGARRLLERMRDAGLKRVIASASKREEVEQMLELARIADLVEASTSASEVEDPKPEPDVVVAALDKLALAPEQVLLLGDTPYDLQAARRVGIGVVAVQSGGWGEEDLAEALAVYRDAAEIANHFEDSPFADGKN